MFITFFIVGGTQRRNEMRISRTDSFTFTSIVESGSGEAGRNRIGLVWPKGLKAKWRWRGDCGTEQP